MTFETNAPFRAANEPYCLDQGPRLCSPPQRPPAAAASGAVLWARAVTPEQILKSFNTRAFKREQPHNQELMLEFIAQAHARRAPISFVMYWGKGLRSTLAAPEYACLDYLKTMIARIDGIYAPGAQLTLVFTDTHAALNGHPSTSIHSYFQDFERAARDHGFNTCLLSTLVNAPGLLPEEMPKPELPPEDVLTDLRMSAAKWFKGEGTPEEGAVRYFQANLLERKVMERAFPRSIFITFNGSQLKSLFPETLPIFYMFSLRHGVSDKPWFLPPDYAGRQPLPNQQTIRLAEAALEPTHGPTS